MREIVSEVSSADEFGWLLKLAGALFFVAALALSATIRVWLPFTPVPVTMQTLVVMIAGAALGVRWGVGAVATYLAAGAAGGPFFAGCAGWAAIAGPTGGYLIGFVAGAAVAGLAYRRTWYVRAGCLLASLAAIYACGLFHLAIIWRLGGHEAVAVGFLPFVVGDVAKYFIATAALGPFAAAFKRLF